ncbi:tyrosine-type recombinase/integrase [Paenibacillus glycinis]|uniref:tyrosine-type recombinase/integrase n=1 Tax=Paenibacillus glycinis TaxID=2697035 RepID=UPI001F23014C|nr:tyrosine-type recombinase/integrase [Paenibacillus glycinis]
MKMVYPLREKKQIELVRSYLKSKSIINYLMFQIGILSVLRISDILALKVKHIWNRKKPAEYIEINEQKTGKYKRFPITPNLSKAIKEYASENDMSDPEAFLFRSREGENKPITRQQAHRILDRACDMCVIQDRFGSHGLRKTWAYFAFKSGISLDLVPLH